MIRKAQAVRNCIILIALFLAVTACTPSRYEPAINVYRSPAPVTQGFHTVVSGETLYSIAWRYNRDYKELARLNNISAPYAIHPGLKVNLNLAPSYKSPKLSTQPKSSTPVQTTRYKKTDNDAKPVQQKVATPRHKAVDMSWSWPVNGSVIEAYSLYGKVNKGIDMAGKHGEPVRSAADGHVVYSGTGLVGYGNLVIVKHNEVYLSAYAHNSRLLVKEGQSVKEGQQIAEIGSTGASRDKLHFEIRRYGKPVDPMQYLPKR